MKGEYGSEENVVQTTFIPNDDAWEEFFAVTNLTVQYFADRENTVDGEFSLLDYISENLATQLILYHIIPYHKVNSTPSAMNDINTLELEIQPWSWVLRGNSLSYRDGQLIPAVPYKNASIIEADIEFCSRIVHIIDAVLISDLGRTWLENAGVSFPLSVTETAPTPEDEFD